MKTFVDKVTDLSLCVEETFSYSPWARLSGPTGPMCWKSKTTAAIRPIRLHIKTFYFRSVKIILIFGDWRMKLCEQKNKMKNLFWWAKWVFYVRSNSNFNRSNCSLLVVATVLSCVLGQVVVNGPCSRFQVTGQQLFITKFVRCIENCFVAFI